jgi:hypothetical protein
MMGICVLILFAIAVSLYKIENFDRLTTALQAEPASIGEMTIQWEIS